MELNQTIALCGADYTLRRLKGSEILLRTGLPEQLVQLLSEKNLTHSSQSGTAVVGRGEILSLQYRDEITLVARQYRRGGVVRYFIGESFFRNPRSPLFALRPLRELLILSYLRQNGVAVPEPIGARIVYSYLCLRYKAQLFTQQIQASENLMTILKRNDERGEAYCYQAGLSAARIFSLGVSHPDLYPGNVLIADGGVYIIDFDKACFFDHRTTHLHYQELMLSRWSRSITKNLLSDRFRAAYQRGLCGG